MTALTADLNLTDEIVHIDGPLTVGEFYHLEDEVVQVRAKLVLTYTDVTQGTRWRVSRGEDHTTPATHVSGTSFTLAREFEAGTGGGGVTVLEDPGVAWVATHVYAEGDRFRETIDGEVRVFEITSAGTSGSGLFADYGSDLGPRDNEWSTGSETFVYRGIVGELPWTVVPALPPALQIGEHDGDGRPLIYTSDAPTDASSNLFDLQARIDGDPTPVFEIATDGDADWTFEDGNSPGMRWNNRGNAFKAEITSEGFRVFTATQTFAITYNPFTVTVIGLPAANPNVAGRLYSDGAPSAGVGKALMVSGG